MSFTLNSRTDIHELYALNSRTDINTRADGET